MGEAKRRGTFEERKALAVALNAEKRKQFVAERQWDLTVRGEQRGRDTRSEASVMAGLLAASIYGRGVRL